MSLDGSRPANAPRPQPPGPPAPFGAATEPASRADAVTALLDEAIAWQRAIARADAHLNNAILGIVGIHLNPDDEDWGREEIASALRLSGQPASERIDVARALATRLFLTNAALRKGEITLRHATEMAKALQPLTDDDLCARTEARVLDAAAGRTPAQLGRHARNEAIRADPQGADERHRKARRTRYVEFSPLPDGMAELRAILAADGAARLRATIDELAGRTRTGDDKRTIDQRRADALVALGELGVLHSRTAGNGPTASSSTNTEPNANDRTDGPDGPSARRAARSRVALIAPLSTVLGATDLPGDLVNYGPVPPTIVRELAADAKWEKWSTDRDGTITDLGRTAYRPPARLANLVRATYPRCVFPGCSQPSYRCDLDHVMRWTDGGTTSDKNLIALCRRHHRAKDEGGWRVRRNTDASCDWTSPAGREYHVDAPRHLADLSDGPQEEGWTVHEDWTVDLTASSPRNAATTTADPASPATATGEANAPGPAGRQRERHTTPIEALLLGAPPVDAFDELPPPF